MYWKRNGKYNNRKTVIDGIKFDSRAEAMYYLKLKQDKKDGVIKSFDLQPTYTLQDKFRYNGKAIRAIKYKPDFLVTHTDGSKEIIDVKGKRTQVFDIKWKMLQKIFKDDEAVRLTIIEA